MMALGGGAAWAARVAKNTYREQELYNPQRRQPVGHDLGGPPALHTLLFATHTIAIGSSYQAPGSSDAPRCMGNVRFQFSPAGSASAASHGLRLARPPRPAGLFHALAAVHAHSIEEPTKSTLLTTPSHRAPESLAHRRGRTPRLSGAALPTSGTAASGFPACAQSRRYTICTGQPVRTAVAGRLGALIHHRCRSRDRLLRFELQTGRLRSQMMALCALTTGSRRSGARADCERST